MPTLSKADALQLFCYVSYTYERRNAAKNHGRYINTAFENFETFPVTSINFLTNALKKYSNQDYAKFIDIAIPRSGSFYDFALQVRTLKYIKISNPALQAYYRYLECPLGSIDVIPLQLIERLQASIKQKEFKNSEVDFSPTFRGLANTYWWMYMWDRVLTGQEW
jgi:hypothetical protein